MRLARVNDKNCASPSSQVVLGQLRAQEFLVPKGESIRPQSTPVLEGPHPLLLSFWFIL
jgi:hypothetical protein